MVGREKREQEEDLLNEDISPLGQWWEGCGVAADEGGS